MIILFQVLLDPRRLQGDTLAILLPESLHCLVRLEGELLGLVRHQSFLTIVCRFIVASFFLELIRQTLHDGARSHHKAHLTLITSALRLLRYNPL